MYLCTHIYIIIYKIKFLRHDLKAGMNIAEKFWKMETQNLIDPVSLLCARGFIGSWEGGTRTPSLFYATNIRRPAVEPFWVWIMYKPKQMISWRQDKRYDQLKPPRKPILNCNKYYFFLFYITARELIHFQHSSDDVI